MTPADCRPHALILLLAALLTALALAHVTWVHAGRTFGPERPYAVDLAGEEER